MPNLTPKKKAPNNTTGPLGLRFLILTKQGITNKTALPIDKMLYIHLLCPHSEHQKICSDLNSLNTFTKETVSNKVKRPKVGSNAIVRVPVGAGPNKTNKPLSLVVGYLNRYLSLRILLKFLISIKYKYYNWNRLAMYLVGLQGNYWTICYTFIRQPGHQFEKDESIFHLLWRHLVAGLSWFMTHPLWAGPLTGFLHPKVQALGMGWKTLAQHFRHQASNPLVYIWALALWHVVFPRWF